MTSSKLGWEKSFPGLMNGRPNDHSSRTCFAGQLNYVLGRRESLMDADKATPDKFNSERAVRDSYRAHRYLQDLTAEELQQLWRDAFRNLMTINTDGKAAPLSFEHPRH